MQLTLRPATAEDSDILFEWRNHETTRPMMRRSEPISPLAHEMWMAMRLQSTEPFLIALLNGVPVGMIRLDAIPFTGAYDISIIVAPEMRGKGIGKELLHQACDWNEAQLYAQIRDENVASRRIFESCGFCWIAKDGVFGRWSRAPRKRR